MIDVPGYEVPVLDWYESSGWIYNENDDPSFRNSAFLSFGFGKLEEPDLAFCITAHQTFEEGKLSQAIVTSKIWDGSGKVLYDFRRVYKAGESPMVGNIAHCDLGLAKQWVRTYLAKLHKPSES